MHYLRIEYWHQHRIIAVVPTAAMIKKKYRLPARLSEAYSVQHMRSLDEYRRL